VDAAVRELERLYAQLPVLACLGLCEASCGEHIDASTAERRRVLAAGVDLDAPTADGACPALTRTFGVGRCRIHAIRPAICRLWGSSASMPCPHGCVPAGGRVDDAQATRWLLTSMEIGGHPDFGPEVRQVLEVALSDQPAAALLSRLLRGDRSVMPTLYTRIQSLRT